MGWSAHTQELKAVLFPGWETHSGCFGPGCPEGFHLIREGRWGHGGDSPILSLPMVRMLVCWGSPVSRSIQTPVEHSWQGLAWFGPCPGCQERGKMVQQWSLSLKALKQTPEGAQIPRVA